MADYEVAPMVTTVAWPKLLIYPANTAPPPYPTLPREGSGSVTSPAAYAAGTGTRQDTFQGDGGVPAPGGITSPAAYAAGTGTRQDVTAGSGSVTSPAAYADGTGLTQRDGTGVVTSPAMVAAGVGVATDVQGIIVSPQPYAAGTGLFAPWVELETVRRVPRDATMRRRPQQDKQATRRAPAWPDRNDTYLVD
jgi:hypothetical protein